MGRFGKSFTTATVITLWLFCMTFGFGTLYTLATGGDVVAYAGQCVVFGLVIWVFSTMGMYELHGWIEERNKPREHSADPPNDKTGADSN